MRFGYGFIHARRFLTRCVAQCLAAPCRGRNRQRATAWQARRARVARGRSIDPASGNSLVPSVYCEKAKRAHFCWRERHGVRCCSQTVSAFGQRAPDARVAGVSHRVQRCRRGRARRPVNVACGNGWPGTTTSSACATVCGSRCCGSRLRGRRRRQGRPTPTSTPSFSCSCATPDGGRSWSRKSTPNAGGAIGGENEVRVRRQNSRRARKTG